MPAAENPCESIRVLVVDDEPAMRSAVVRVLSKFRFRAPELDHELECTVSEADSGEDALRSIEQSPPDIVLLDYKLPGLSGIAVLEQITGRHADLLIIMITAYASIETAVRATKQGAYDFLPKPFTPSEIKSVVQKAAVQQALRRHARKLAEEKKRIRFEFVRVLGHELKAPLGAVSNYLAILKNRTLGDQLNAYGEVIGRSQVRLDQMEKLVADLLDMTRIESGQRSRELAEIDLAAAAQRAIELVDGQARGRGIEVSLVGPAPFTIVADRVEMEMVLNNLVSNAVKYNRDGGRVTVALSADGPAAVIAVADSGIGMTEEEMKRLFQEFARIRNQKTSRILGSGLGLSIVRKLAELYGGSVSVASVPDSGSTFTVRLPGVVKS